MIKNCALCSPDFYLFDWFLPRNVETNGLSGHPKHGHAQKKNDAADAGPAP